MFADWRLLIVLLPTQCSMDVHGLSHRSDTLLISCMCAFHVAFGGHWHTFPPIHYSPALRVRLELKARPLTSPRPCYECGHLWLDGGSLLWNPSPRVVSMWKRWGTVRLQQRERNAHIHTHRRTVTHTELCGDFPSTCPALWWAVTTCGVCLFFCSFSSTGWRII